MSKPLPSVVIFVSDVPRVTNFYQDLAAMRVVSGDASHQVLEIDGFQLVIHQIYGETDGAGTQGPTLREDSYMKVCLPVSGIDEARRIASERGGFVKGPEAEWEARGFRACDGNDPEGNIIQVRVAV